MASFANGRHILPDRAPYLSWQKKQCEELEPDVTIGEVAKELRLAVDDPDGISPIDRTRWSTSN